MTIASIIITIIIDIITISYIKPIIATIINLIISTDHIQAQKLWPEFERMATRNLGNNEKWAPDV